MKESGTVKIMEDSRTNPRLKREIQLKKARVAFLVQTVSENAPFAVERFKDGFFTQSADTFRDFAAHAMEIAKLNEGIVQLSFEVERIESQQTAFSFVGGVL